MYASIEQGGLYRSDDGGDSFTEIPGMYNDVHRLVSNPADPKRMFVTGGMGLWLSRDYGASWDNVFSRGSEYGGYPDQLVYKPSDPSYMLITAGQESPGRVEPEPHLTDAHLPQPRRRRDVGSADGHRPRPTSSCPASRR